MVEFSETNGPLSEILKIYEDKGFLDKGNYEVFLEIKLNITGKAERAEKSKSVESAFKHKVVKIPCPHCNFLCSPHIQFCKKCGEPLPKLEKFGGYSGVSDVSHVDYTERNIINSLEKLINKSIPLSEKFNMSTTCYVKGGEEITGLSIFNCGLKAFSSEILRLKSLKHLALRRNNLGHLPKDIGFLSTLEYLDLRINNLETLPNALGLLIKLENLNVSSNKLKAIPDSIGNLLMLIKINFSGNILKTIQNKFKGKDIREVEISATSYVGIFNIPDTENSTLIVRPKIGSTAFLQMLHYTNENDIIIQNIFAHGLEESSNFVQVFVHFLIKTIYDLLLSSMRKGYDLVKEDRLFVKGKVDYIKTIEHRIKSSNLLVCQYHRFNCNTLINKAIKYTLIQIRDVISSVSIRCFREVSKLLDSVDISNFSLKDFNRITYNRLTIKFKYIIEFCSLILKNQMVSLEKGYHLIFQY